MPEYFDITIRPYLHYQHWGVSNYCLTVFLSQHTVAELKTLQFVIGHWWLISLLKTYTSNYKKGFKKVIKRVSRKFQAAIYWAIPEKKANRGLRIWNFQGYWKRRRNSKWIFQELFKNNMKFPRVIKQKSCGISSDLGFRP